MQETWNDTRDNCWGFLLAQVTPDAEPGSPAASGVGGNQGVAEKVTAPITILVYDTRTGALPPPAIISPCGGSGHGALPSLLSAMIYSLIGKASHVINISNLAPPPIKTKPVICLSLPYPCLSPACTYRSISYPSL